MPASTPRAMSAIGARSEAPSEPSDLTGGVSPPFSASANRSAMTGRMQVDPPQNWLSSTSMAARTTSRGASGPWPTWLSAICRQLNESSSRRSDVRFCAPRPVVSPYVGRPRSKMCSASELASVIASNAGSPIWTGSS